MAMPCISLGCPAEHHDVVVMGARQPTVTDLWLDLAGAPARHLARSLRAVRKSDSIDLGAAVCPSDQKEKARRCV